MDSPTQFPPPDTNQWVSDRHTPTFGSFLAKLWLAVLLAALVAGVVLLFLPTGREQSADAPSFYEAGVRKSAIAEAAVERIKTTGAPLIRSFLSARSFEERLPLFANLPHVEPMLREYAKAHPLEANSPIPHSKCDFYLPWRLPGEEFATNAVFSVALTNLDKIIPEINAPEGILMVPVIFEGQKPFIDAEYFFAYYGHLLPWFTERPRSFKMSAYVTAQRVAIPDKRAAEPGWVCLKLTGSSLPDCTPKVVFRETSAVWDALKSTVNWEDFSRIRVELAWSKEFGQEELTISRVLSARWGFPAMEISDSAQQEYMESLEFETPHE